MTRPGGPAEPPGPSASETVLVVRQPTRRAWARGIYRGEVWRRTTRMWGWRVWNAVGGAVSERGEEVGVRRASAACIIALVRAEREGVTP